MLHIDRPLIVEGKYDKLRLSQIIDGVILTTDGFGVFKSAEKRMLIRRLAAEKGVIVLTDPDGAGLVIRNFLRGILPQEQVTHLYIPSKAGKERRKAQPSREGLLGVEGTDVEILEKILQPFAAGAEKQTPYESITKTVFYEDGFSGGAQSAQRRKLLAVKAGLPQNMSCNALLEALNLLGGLAYYRSLCAQLPQIRGI